MGALVAADGRPTSTPCTLRSPLADTPMAMRVAMFTTRPDSHTFLIQRVEPR